MLIPVKFLRNWNIYFEGEVAGFTLEVVNFLTINLHAELLEEAINNDMQLPIKKDNIVKKVAKNSKRKNAL